MATRLPASLQQTIVTVVTLGEDDHAKLASSMVSPELFDPPLDDIVSKAQRYRKEYGRPPGRQHVDDVFAHILENKSHRDFQVYDDLLGRMLRLDEMGVLTRYALDEVVKFVRLQQLRENITTLVQRYNEGEREGEGTQEFFGEIESILRGTLRIRDINRDLGFTLADQQALGFLYRDAKDYCKIGIPEFDAVGLHPAKKELLLFIAARNRGKSMFLHHCGKYALLQHWKVAHYTLENSADMTSQRYFQTLFSGAKRDENLTTSTFDYKGGELVGISQHELEPDFLISDADHTAKFLRGKIKSDLRLRNLRIREFPPGKMSFEDLERDLDELEMVEKFVPDLLLIDYPAMMKYRRGDREYVSLGEIGTQLRGLGVERDMAVAATSQGNRASESASTVYGHHLAGSIELLAIADNAITYSQTALEEKLGLARLFAQKVRNDAARFTVSICQHYPTAQFCLESHVWTDKFKDILRKYEGDNEGEDDDEEGARDRIRRRR